MARGSQGWEVPPDGLSDSEEYSAKHYGYAPMAIDRLTVVTMVEGGRQTDTAWNDVSRLGSLTTTVEGGPRQLAEPDDLFESNADVVEVRLPMQVKNYEEEKMVVLMTFGLFWNREQKQWLPVYNRIYFEENTRFVSPMM